MRGLKFTDLLAILDFLYYGEANIYQENLDTFLNIAEELDLKGLNDGEGGSEEEKKYEESTLNPKDIPTVVKAGPRKNKNLSPPQNQPIYYDSFVRDTDCSKFTVAHPKDKISGDLKDLDDKNHDGSR